MHKKRKRRMSLCSDTWNIIICNNTIQAKKIRLVCTAARDGCPRVGHAHIMIHNTVIPSNKEWFRALTVYPEISDPDFFKQLASTLPYLTELRLKTGCKFANINNNMMLHTLQCRNSLLPNSIQLPASLTDLDVSFCTAEPQFSFGSCLPTLTSLNISGAAPMSLLLKVQSHATNKMQKLDVSGNLYADITFVSQTMCISANLRSFSARACMHFQADSLMCVLQRCTRLEFVNVSGCYLKSRDLHFRHASSSLQFFIAQQGYLLPVSIYSMAAECTRLQRVDLTKCDCGGMEQSELRALFGDVIIA